MVTRPEQEEMEPGHYMKDLYQPQLDNKQICKSIVSICDFKFLSANYYTFHGTMDY